MPRTAKVRIKTKLLKRSLGFPENCEIIEAKMLDAQTTELLVESAEFPDRPTPTVLSDPTVLQIWGLNEG